MPRNHPGDDPDNPAVMHDRKPLDSAYPQHFGHFMQQPILTDGDNRPVHDVAGGPSDCCLRHDGFHRVRFARTASTTPGRGAGPRRFGQAGHLLRPDHQHATAGLRTYDSPAGGSAASSISAACA
jgi:hypothetical protein